jgi:ribosomal protein S1
MTTVATAAHSGFSHDPANDFAALLDEFAPASPRQFGRLTCTVVSKDANGFRVDHHGKSEAFMPLAEAGDAEVGSVIETVVIGNAMAFGRPGEFDETALCVSHKRVQLSDKIVDLKAKAQGALDQWKKGQLPSEDTIKEVVCYGYVVGVNKNKFKRDAGLDVKIVGSDIAGFVPGDEINQRLPGMSRFKDFVGKTIPLVVEVPQKGHGDRSKAVFSHTKAIDLVTCVYLRGLRVGMTVDAEVIRHSFYDNGEIKGVVLAVTDIVTGFVPNPLVSYSRDVAVAEALPVRKKVKAIVDEVNPGKLNLKLSTRKATIDWEKIKTCTGEHSGEVFHIVEREDRKTQQKYQSQLLVKLDNGLIAEVWYTDVTPRSRIPIGQRCPKGTRVTGLVYDYDRSYGRLKLKLTPMSDPILKRLEEAKGEVVEGMVMSKADFGYFIGFDSGDGSYLVDGLCHNAKLKKVDGVEETLTIGEKVKVRVENVIAGETRTVSLTRKDVEG